MDDITTTAGYEQNIMPDQLQYWSEKLNVAQETLNDAVSAVGTKLEYLEKYLEACQFVI